jgi:hypothetical protein
MNPSTVWANSWFEPGFAFVALGLVITAVGVVMHFRREVPSASPPSAVSPADAPSPAIPRAVNQAVWEAVRPGRYRSRWQGRLQAGEWTEITGGEHEVKAPSPLIVTIIDRKFENWKHIALIAALRVKITNTIGETIRLSGFGFTYDPEGLPVLDTSFIGDRGR